MITLHCVSDSPFLLLLSDRDGGSRRKGDALLPLVDWRLFARRHSFSQPVSPSVRRFPSPRRATLGCTRMAPQLIGLIALLVATGLLLLLVLVQRHQRRSRRLRAATLGLQPSPSPDGDAPLPTRHCQISSG